MWLSRELREAQLVGADAVMNAVVGWPSRDLRGPIDTLIAPDHLRFALFSSFQRMRFRICGNFWVAGTGGSVDQLLGSMGAGVFIIPPDIRAWTSCPYSCMCGLGTVKGSMRTLPSREEGLHRQRRLLDRVDKGFVDRWGVKSIGTRTRLERRWLVFLHVWIRSLINVML